MKPDVARLQRRVQELEAENAQLRLENAQLQQQIEHLRRENQSLHQVVHQLGERIRVLEHRLHRNSSNSSRPPSTDPPGTPPAAPKPPPSGRKPGGQPGHPPANRKPFPPEQVDQGVELYPQTCHECHQRILASTHSEMWLWLIQQVVEIPAVAAQVTEYQCHGSICRKCGALNVAQAPPEIRGLLAGPRLQAVASVLSGRFRLSRREVEEALVALFGPKAHLALGTISNLETQTSAALASVYQEAHQAVQAAPRANFDETGWREQRKRAWLWVMVTSLLTVFHIDRRRGRPAFEALAGEFKGVLSSDRWRAYMHWVKRFHQFCWSHLKRDFQSWADLGGSEGKIGTACLNGERQVMHLWHRFKKEEISRATLQGYLSGVRRKLRKLLRRGKRWKLMARPCGELLEYWPCLWVFARIPGVEPTNNVGEQEIRPAVLWRKGSFGSHSPQGSRFVERMLTVTRSLRKQGRAVLDFLVEAIVAFRQGRRGPSLLPDPGG